MSKLEKAIRGLRDIDIFIAGRLEHEKAINFLRTIDETIDLLKEQDETIKELQNAYDYLQKQFFEAQDKLLKEQEAVEPIHYHRSDGTIFKYECRKCRTKIFKMDLFCRHCGQAVKWDV